MQNPDMKAGTAGGVLLVLLLQIDAQELLKTIVFAAVGAAVSFGVSACLQSVIRRRKGKK